MHMPGHLGLIDAEKINSGRDRRVGRQASDQTLTRRGTPFPGLGVNEVLAKKRERWVFGISRRVQKASGLRDCARADWASRRSTKKKTPAASAPSKTCRRLNRLCV